MLQLLDVLQTQTLRCSSVAFTNGAVTSATTILYYFFVDVFSGLKGIAVV